MIYVAIARFPRKFKKRVKKLGIGVKMLKDTEYKKFRKRIRRGGRAC